MYSDGCHSITRMFIKIYDSGCKINAVDIFCCFSIVEPTLDKLDQHWTIVEIILGQR